MTEDEKTTGLQWVDEDGNPIDRPAFADLGPERQAAIAEAFRRTDKPPPP